MYLNTKKSLEQKLQAKNLQPTDDQMRQYLRQAPEVASAEANSILKMAEIGDKLVLLSTATPLAQRCVELLKSYFVKEGFPHTSVVNLQFEASEEHIEKQGIRNLISVLASQIAYEQKKNQEVIINATSGYKAQVVYSTVLGMLYQVPVQYIHEEFKRVVTFNPIALELDISIFINNFYFFKWIEDEQYAHSHNDVELQLNRLVYEEDERARIRSFLEPADQSGEVLLSPMAFTLFKKAGEYREQAVDIPMPSPSGIIDIDKKISASLLELKHHYPDDILVVCRKIANLDCVKLIHGEFFSGTTRSRMGTFNERGVIHLRWADNTKAGRLTIHTTAEGLPQTIKVRNQIQELLELS